MTDWSQLSHAYGSAEDMPTLLGRIAREPEPELWSDLWSALCHQGSVYSASFAALPWLADVAGSDDREQAVNALTLAGAIMAGAEQQHGAGDVRTHHAVEVESLLAAAKQHLRMTSDRIDYIHLLEAMLGFEGVVGWSEDLAQGLGNEEYEVDCPGCEAGLFIVLGERGFFSTSEDYALSDDDVEGRPLLPANPADLDGIGRRLHDIAISDGQHEVAHALTHVFGHATCPDCETGFSVADQVGADWPA
ncbi:MULTISPECIES: hypothetical protein [unclassified Streptomyces]|uniref:hypothetical protein n=1 Tax=unclassified Streptomyces TaxID=2593676 RepID=UPI003803B31E